MKAEFKGVWIPDFIMEMVWNEELNPTDAFLLATIHALSKRREGCTAKREYLAQYIRVGEGHVKKLIAKYRKMGLVIDLDFNGRTQAIKTCWDNEPKTRQPYHKRHGSSVLKDTAEITSSDPSSTRGVLKDTADQAIYNIYNKDYSDFFTNNDSNESSFKELKSTEQQNEVGITKQTLLNKNPDKNSPDGNNLNQLPPANDEYERLKQIRLAKKAKKVPFKTTPSFSKDNPPRDQSKPKKTMEILITENQMKELVSEFSKVDVEYELRKTKDYLKSRGEGVADGLAYFRNWLRRAQDNAPESTITYKRI